jgi:hypothetical protein
VSLLDGVGLSPGAEILVDHVNAAGKGEDTGQKCPSRCDSEGEPRTEGKPTRRGSGRPEIVPCLRMPESNEVGGEFGGEKALPREW